MISGLKQEKNAFNLNLAHQQDNAGDILKTQLSVNTLLQPSVFDRQFRSDAIKRNLQQSKRTLLINERSLLNVDSLVSYPGEDYTIIPQKKGLSLMTIHQNLEAKGALDRLEEAAESKQKQTMYVDGNNEVDCHKVLENASQEIRKMNNRLAKLFRSSKNSDVELRAENFYEFDLAPECEFSYAKVNLNNFSDGIKFTIKPDKNQIIGKNIDLVIYVSKKFSQPNKNNCDKVYENVRYLMCLS